MIEMGVYHVSGLGRSPGALTMPLTCVYILQAAARLGHKDAREFFALSGERERKGSYEKSRGEPEAIIVFDSKEAIEGNLKLNYQSNWFGMAGGKQETISEPIEKYLCKLIGHLNQILEKEGANVLNPPKYFYLISVDYQDFEDVFKKAGGLFYGIRRKEVWVNLIGGSNQINLALMVAGAYTAVPSRYYYVFQNAITLEPIWLQKPKDERGILRSADTILARWYDFPPLNLGIGSILRALIEEFEGRKYLSKKEVVDILRDRGYTEKFIPKLISEGYLVSAGEDVFQKGSFLDRIRGLLENLREYMRINSLSQWKNEFSEYITEVEFQC